MPRAFSTANVIPVNLTKLQYDWWLGATELILKVFILLYQLYGVEELCGVVVVAKLLLAMLVQDSLLARTYHVHAYKEEQMDRQPELAAEQLEVSS